MDMTLAKNKLIKTLENFLEGKISNEELLQFVWGIIDYFTNTPKENLPKTESSENVFWFAIWQIQHLAGESIESKNSMRLAEVLKYLREEKILPPNMFGCRP
jgi:hypothetical protein